MKIIKGKIRKPLAVMIYGMVGLGKTSLAEEFPSPVFISPEEIDEIDAPRFPRVKSFDEFLECLRLVRAEEYKTLVIDGLDGIQTLAEQKVLSLEPGKTMATACGGYGKAYEKVEQMFLSVKEDLIKLRSKGMNIVLVCHAIRSKFTNQVELVEYDRYEPTLHEKKVRPIFIDWVCMCLFITNKVYKAETASGKESGIGMGERIIYCEERPGFIAKNKIGMPATIDYVKGLGFAEINKYNDAFYLNKNGELEVLKKEVDSLVESLSDADLKAKALEFLAKSGNSVEGLESIKKRLLILTKKD